MGVRVEQIVEMLGIFRHSGYKFCVQLRHTVKPC